MAVQDTLLNTVFDGRYRIVRKLGAGGMAMVYLAEDQELGRRVAIKILNERHASDDQFIERFRREAKNAAGLSHPNVVSIYDRGEAEGTYYIAMEYLDGRSLKELIVTRGPTPIPIAIDYARQILAAVGFAHRHGIIHRDIKPHNVLVDAEGRLKVTDFGIARSGASQITEVGSIIGTAQYLSPEQARGAPVDQRSDLYSVGIVLYEMLTGAVPFSGDTPLEIAMKHLSTVPEPPSESRADVPHDLDLIVLRALAKNQEERYQAAADMDADLAKVARGLAVSTETADAATAVLAGSGVAVGATTAVVPPPPTVPVRRPPPKAPAGYYGYEGPPPRRRPLWPWLLAVLLLAAAGLAGWFAYDKIQNQLNSTVAVPSVEGLHEAQAVKQIKDAGLRPVVKPKADDTVPKGDVINQSPDPGAKVDKNAAVRLFVSTGKPKTTVPDVRGSTRDAAVATLGGAHLQANVVPVYSNRAEGAVIAQFPLPGKKVLYGTKVRINVSQGLKPLSVPSVVGQPYEQARGTLEGAGFNVERTETESNQASGTVLSQDPPAGSLASKGSTVRLTVSKGPKNSTVPDVTSQEQAVATGALQRSGFKVTVQNQNVEDSTQDGIVLDQSPAGGTQAPKGSPVRITVGRFVGPAPAP